MILFVDDDPQMKTLFGLYFKDTPFIYADNYNEAHSILRHKDISVLVTDFALHDKLGTDLARFAQTELKIPVIIITAYSHAIKDIKNRFKHVLSKPLDWMKLKELVTQIPNETVTKLH